jgi:hypothetical protein
MSIRTSPCSCSAPTRKSQLLSISPSSTWIEPPSTLILPLKDIVNDKRHEERHSREVVDAAFEVAVGGSEDQRGDPLLKDCQPWQRAGHS